MQTFIGKALPRTFSTLLNSQNSKLAEFLNPQYFSLNTPISNNNTQTIQASLNEPASFQPENKGVKLLSYNIFVRPPLIHNNGNDYKDERLQEFIKVSKDYDIICLQEMFGAWSDRKDKLIEQAKEAGFLYHATSSKPPTFSHLLIDGGLLILSKYPIENSEFCPYPYGIGSDFYVEKGVLYAKVKVGDAKLHLYTTHAQATYDGNLKYFLKRTEQFGTLHAFAKDTLVRNEYNDNDMVLLTGDFNVNGRDAQRFQNDNTELNSAFQKFDSLIKKGSYSEYDALVTCLTNNFEDYVEDLLKKNYGEHPITFGDYYMTSDNEKKPRETVLTHKSCLCAAESLDYIFKYVPKGISSIRGKSALPKQNLAVKKNSAAVERFMTFGQRFGQLSDHYGVRVTLQHQQEDKLDTAGITASSYVSEHAQNRIN